MENFEILTAICDINRQLGNLNGILRAHYKTLDNVVQLKADTTKVITVLQYDINEIKSTIKTLDKKLDQFILQGDFKEKQLYKTAKETKELKTQLKDKKFNWKLFFAASTKVFSDWRTIAVAIAMTVGGILVALGVIPVEQYLKSLASWIK